VKPKMLYVVKPTAVCLTFDVDL